MMPDGKASPILNSEISGCIRPIEITEPFSLPNGTCYRDIEEDIRKFNALSLQTTVAGLLHESALFLFRQFGWLTIQEIYLSRNPGKTPELIAKSRCRCGNIVTAPLRMLIDGSLNDCGCTTPLPKQEANKIIVYQSERPIRWTTTVDGIQWFGSRYIWFVTLTVGQRCFVRKYADTAKEALEIRRDAERQYFGRSIIDQYYEIMLAELEELEQIYVRRHPPEVPGISWDKTEKRWIARLWYRGKWILNKSFKTRKEAAKARYEAEVRYLGESTMPERYYV